MSVSEAFFFAVLGVIVSIVTSAATTALQTWKWKTGEQPKTQAEADKAKADAAGELTDTSLSLVIAVRNEMKSNQEKATTEMNAMRTELAAVREENRINREKLAELEDVKEWAERLVHQVRSLGGDPVKMRVRPVKI